MATFYIQLEDRLLQISGELTAENISKALGYVPADSSIVNNISFDNLKDNPFLSDGSGELNITDEAGNIIAKINSEGIHSVDFVAGNHKLTDKIDSSALNGYAKESWVTSEITKAATEGKVDLTGYATEEWVTEQNYLSNIPDEYVTQDELSAMSYLTQHQDISHLATKDQLNNIDFTTLENNPFNDDETGELNITDESGNIGLKLNDTGLYVKDVISGSHILSNKANLSDLPTKVSELENDSNFITVNDIPKVEIPSLEEYVTEEELNQKGYLTEHQDISYLASKEWVNNKNYATEYDLQTIDYSEIQNVPLNEDENGEFLVADENGNIAMKVSAESIYGKDFTAGEHILSNKQDVIPDLDELRNKIKTLETSLEEALNRISQLENQN